MRYLLTNAENERTTIFEKSAVSWGFLIDFELEKCLYFSHRQYFGRYCVKKVVRSITASEKEMTAFFQKVFTEKLVRKMKKTVERRKIPGYLSNLFYQKPTIFPI